MQGRASSPPSQVESSKPRIKKVVRVLIYSQRCKRAGKLKVWSPQHLGPVFWVGPHMNDLQTVWLKGQHEKQLQKHIDNRPATQGTNDQALKLSYII